MKNIIKPLAKSILIPLGLTVTNAAIYQNMFRSGITTLIILNEQINDIMKIDKSLEESSSLIKDVSETIKNEAKEQKGRFRSMFIRYVRC